MSKEIIIHDTVHGSISIDPFAGQLLGVPDVQRLAGIKQLGLACLVFTGANHTRLEHSIGTYHVARRMAAALGLDDEETSLISSAALLHDLGHGPYSHTLEILFHDRAGMDHMELTKDVITGKNNMVPNCALPEIQNGKTVSEVLEENSVEPSAVGELVCGTPGNDRNDELFTHQGQGFFNDKVYQTHIIHGSIDCDQIDYLLRDSHYTGVAHGTIDLARLLQTLTIFNNDLVVKEKGLSAVEGMLVARSLMFSSVYFHKTVRISELMLAKAVEMALDKEDTLTIQRMDDAELMGWLHGLGGFQKEMVERLKFRRLYKAAFGKRVADLTEGEQERLLDITNNDEWPVIEKAICQRLGLKAGAIVIDIPEPDLLLSEPRIARADIKVLSDGRLRSLSKMTPFSKAIQQKKISRWAFLVACDKVNVPKVAKTAEKLIFK